MVECPEYTSTQRLHSSQFLLSQWILLCVQQTSLKLRHDTVWSGSETLLKSIYEQCPLLLPCLETSLKTVGVVRCSLSLSGILSHSHVFHVLERNFSGAFAPEPSWKMRLRWPKFPRDFYFECGMVFAFSRSWGTAPHRCGLSRCCSTISEWHQPAPLAPTCTLYAIL